MKAVDLLEIGNLQLVEKPKPIPGEGEVLLRIKACGICGSDIPRAFINGSYYFPTVLGHEFSGQIVELGKNVSKEYFGKKAAVFPLIPCGQCEYCETGNYAQCKNYNYFGSRTDGGFEEYLAVPVFNLVMLKDSVQFEEGAMLEPATVAQHVVNKAQVDIGDNVVIFGAGPIGMLVAQWAKISGANRVVLIDIDEKKVEFAKKIGYEFVYNSLNEPAEDIIRTNFGGELADIAIEATGSSSGFNSCVGAMKTFGTVVLLGNPHSDMTLGKKSYDQFMRKEGTIKGMFNSVYVSYPKNEWQVTAEAIAQRKLNLQPLVTHRVSIDELVEAFQMIYNKKENYCKVLMVDDDLL